MATPPPTYAITGIRSGVTDTTVPLRLEVDSWYPGQTTEHLLQNSLFLHALHCLQQRDPSHRLSFFQIAGIHGLPYQPWDEDTDTVTPNEGYCTHDSLLFPCWHRPYMLLYEQVVHEIMVKQVIPQLPEDKRQDWLRASDTWRLPYWDWAQKKARAGKDDPLYDVPLIAHEPRIAVLDLNDGVTEVYIDNPMYKFTMPNNEKPGAFGVSDVQDEDPNGKIMTIPFSKSVGTSRWATYEPESDKVSAAWAEGTVRNSKITDALNSHPWYGKGVDPVPLAEMVYRLYLHDYITSFTQFATTKFKDSPDYDPNAPQAFLNLEYVHNNIHNWTGGTDVGYIGHMAEPVVAGFDPIFWMHHANVDRQFALWQAINQKDNTRNWFQDPSEQLQDDGTWSIKAGDIDTPSTHLAPFHKDTSGTYFTSDDIRDWTKWGYSYPELQPWLDKYKVDGQYDEDLYIADVRAQLKALYSPFGDDDRLQTVPQGPSREHWTKDVIVNVTYNRFAFNGTPYTIYFFIGAPSALDDYSGPLHEHPQHVGFVYTFSNPIYRNRAAPGCASCRRKAAEGTPSRAQVPITGALVARTDRRYAALAANATDTEWGAAVLGGRPHGVHPLPGLEVDTVGEYLEKHLHWRVRSHTGRDLEIPEENPFVEVSVYHRDARFDDVGNDARYERVGRATRTKRGGFSYTPASSGSSSIPVR